MRCKQIADRHGSTFEQEALASLIDSGTYERHVRKMRRINSERRAAFLSAMSEAFGETVEIVGTSAGLHVVGWFNGFGSEVEEEFARAALAAGIGIYPISRSFSERSDRQAGFVFGYASMPVEKIPEGVTLLATVLPARF